MAAMTEMTVGEIAAQSISAVRVFERFGIDYCCGGKRGLADVCRERGINPSQVEAALAEEDAAAGSPDDWRSVPLRELIQHIVAAHHEFLKLELPRLEERMRKVLAAHGAKDPGTLRPMSETLRGLSDELLSHLHKEEAVLFPAIERYESAFVRQAPLPPAPFGSIANPIAMMEREHEDAGAALARIRELTKDFTIPAWACNTVRALWQGLEELEADTHRHIHLENNILFPRVIAMERAAAE